MIVRILAAAALSATAGPAMAQQPMPMPQQSPMEQALAGRLITEVNAALQCSATTIVLQQQITALQNQLAEAKKAPAAAEDKP